MIRDVEVGGINSGSARGGEGFLHARGDLSPRDRFRHHRAPAVLPIGVGEKVLQLVGRPSTPRQLAPREPRNEGAWSSQQDDQPNKLCEEIIPIRPGVCKLFVLV